VKLCWVQASRWYRVEQTSVEKPVQLAIALIVDATLFSTCSALPTLPAFNEVFKLVVKNDEIAVSTRVVPLELVEDEVVTVTEAVLGLALVAPYTSRAFANR
jgi:hypothetical protein